MLKIGLTGGIGSGKSTVADIFSSLGITVIDADRIAHQLTQAGNGGFKEIEQLLGKEFIASSGELDRKKIAQHIFSNPEKKTELENILHPKIKQKMLSEIERHKREKFIVLEIPLLIESNFSDLVDRVLVIDADNEIRINRTQQRDDRSEEQIRDIMSHQIDQDQRLIQADDIVYNNANIDKLEHSIKQLHQQYLEMSD